jgi:hypothetical protein
MTWGKVAKENGRQGKGEDELAPASQAMSDKEQYVKLQIPAIPGTYAVRACKTACWTRYPLAKSSTLATC